jgi:hypothetical protein
VDNCLPRGHFSEFKVDWIRRLKWGAPLELEFTPKP